MNKTLKEFNFKSKYKYIWNKYKIKGRDAKYRGTREKVTDGLTRRERRKEKCEVRQSRTREVQEESKGMEKTTKWAMKVCSVGEEKGVKKEVSFHSRRQMKAADGRRLVQTTEAPPCWDCPGSAVQGSAPSPPTSTRLSHPGRTPPARCPLVLHTHTRQTHTVRPAFPSFIHLQRTWGEKAPDDNILTNVTKNLSTMYLSSGFLQTASVLMRTNNTATCYMLIMQLNIGHSVWNRKALEWATLHQRGASWTSGWILYNLVKIYSSSDVS